MSENTPDLVPVAYTGRDAVWTDNLYGSNLPFAQGQTRMVPPELAARLLRHADVFEPGEAPKAKKGAKTDDTAELLAKAELERAEVNKLAFNLQDLRDQIAHMEKPALAHFAKVNYRQDMDMRLKVDTLRQQANAFIDLYGVV
ncbi:MAG: hypothetical protein EOP82_21660 [Variovorax sp.]|nr:MAG: hypothetical protein EOP82_21660 [Variovorax sp.]